MNGAKIFDSSEERTEYIIRNWNSTVMAGDDVYILGDVGWMNAKNTIEILKQLEGHKHLIMGNHDRRLNASVLAQFKSVQDYKRIKDEGIYLNLCHYPLFAHEDQFRKGIHLHRHVHNRRQAKMYRITCNKMLAERQIVIEANCYNVGCMLNYMACTPKTLRYLMLCDNTSRIAIS